MNGETYRAPRFCRAVALDEFLQEDVADTALEADPLHDEDDGLGEEGGHHREFIAPKMIRIGIAFGSHHTTTRLPYKSIPEAS